MARGTAVKAVKDNPRLRAARMSYRRKVRPLFRDVVLAARRVRGAHHSHLPDYLIVGVQKCGTTALFDSLTGSPRFGMPLVKEIRYFDREPLRSLDWYRAHFWSPDPEPRVWGEATPAYFDTPAVPRRVADVLPEVKVIVQVRDPLARAISQYFHAVDYNFEKRPIAEAFADELALLRNGGWRDVEAYQRTGYLARSRYAVALRRWLDLFSADQVCVLVAERRDESVHAAARFILGEDGVGESAPAVRESNTRRYDRPADADLRPAAELLYESCAALPAMAGWDGLPPEWSLLQRCLG